VSLFSSFVLSEAVLVLVHGIVLGWRIPPSILSFDYACEHHCAEHEGEWASGVIPALTGKAVGTCQRDRF